MKHELLVRAMGGLDDGLILEAHEADTEKKRDLTLLKRIGAMAACVALVCAVRFGRGTTENGGVGINGTQLLADPAAQVTFSLEPATQQRGVVGIEIPLDITAGKNGIGLTAGTDTVLLRGEETQESLTLTEDGQVIWQIIPGSRETFELRIRCDGTTSVLTAVVDPTGNALILTVSD